MVRQSNANMERLSLGFPYLISNKRTKLGKGQNKKKLKKESPSPSPSQSPIAMKWAISKALKINTKIYYLENC